MIGFVIVPVEGFFANCKGSLDREGVFVVGGSGGEVFIYVVHCWYDGGDAGCPSGKEKSCILEDLTRKGMRA